MEAHYTCNREWLDNGKARCIAFCGIPVDEAIGTEVLKAVHPAAVEAAVQATQEETRCQDEVQEAFPARRETARYYSQSA